MRRKIAKRLLSMCLAATMALSTFAITPQDTQAAQIIKWSREEGVIATSDCYDSTLTADKAIDGDVSSRTSRWSSVNLWASQDPSSKEHETCHGHWLQLELPSEAKITSVKIYWELKNAKVYYIESSLDGEEWNVVKKMEECPTEDVQEIVFDNAVTLKYIRLRTEEMDTTDTNNVIHPYYQNVSLYEFEVFGEAPASKVINLSRMDNVKATASCSANANQQPEMAIDGEEGYSSRWSSHNPFNDKEYHSHWLQLEFPEQVKADSVTIVWEKANAQDYYLEYSDDGENWTEIKHFTDRPSPLPEGDTTTVDSFFVTQEIAFEESIEMEYIRVRVEEVCTDDSVNIYYPYYQNVSISELKVIGEDPDFELSNIAAELEAPVIITDKDGTRKLSTPEVPEGYTLEFMGADYEQVIGDDGTIYDTIEDKTITFGYKVKKGEKSVETPSFELLVPASVEAPTGEVNERPSVSPELAEWRGATGKYTITDASRIIYGDPELEDVAVVFGEDYESMTGETISVVSGTEADIKDGDIYITLSEEDHGLDTEGYFCDITESVYMYGEDPQGIYWGTRTILQILKQNETYIPKGQIRDYPKYEVRGFGIDVGRQTVSLEMLETIAKTMSWYKMNDLHIHLNDNEILGYSGKIDSVENALTAYSGFRLESDVQNEDGVKLTSSDMYYTKNEFRSFIQDSRTIGINVVPEIDSPAHSLAFSKVFPEYAATTDPSHVDQLNLSADGAVDLMVGLYEEYVDGEDPVFDQNTTVHIGLDEYWGDTESYLQYANTLIDTLDGRTVRMWGSLSNKKGATKIDPENVQMNIWHTRWANPSDMYKQGYGLINSQNGSLYIIPGGGWDYLDTEKIYNTWNPSTFVDSDNNKVTYEIPSYSKQMLGGSYTMWHDLTGTLDYGLTEYDDFARFLQPIAVITEKLWAEGNDKTYEEIQTLSEIVGLSPSTNPYNTVESVSDTVLQYDFEEETCEDTTENGYDALENTAVIVEGKRGNAIDLTGNKTVKTPINKIGPSSRISFWVKRNADAGDEEQILFESIQKEGETLHDYQFKAVQKDTGKVGFSREHYDYSFDYTLPKGEWVYLTVECEQDITKLYVNGELIDTLGSHDTWSAFATFPFPLDTIGSETNGFEGMIDKLTVTNGEDPTVKDRSALESKLEEAKEITAELYTEASYAVLQSEIEKAEAVLTDTAIDAMQVDVDHAVEQLKTAITGLKEKVENPFDDVKEEAYYKDAVLWAVENGITNGTTETTFSPKEDCTRAQVVMFLWRAAGSPEPTSTENPFSDVGTGSRFYKAILWAVENHIVTGYKDGTFRPNDAVRRGEYVTMQWRAAGLPDPSLTENPFADVTETDYPHFYKAILWATENQITEGKDEAHFEPNENCSRANVVTFLYRGMEK